MQLERRTLNQQKHVLRHAVVYGVTWLSPERALAHQLLQLWHEHWHIVNKLQYVRDVTFDEDRSQVRVGHIPQVMAAFRNVTISLFRLLGWTNIAAACRHFAAQPQLAEGWS